MMMMMMIAMLLLLPLLVLVFVLVLKLPSYTKQVEKQSLKKPRKNIARTRREMHSRRKAHCGTCTPTAHHACIHCDC